MFNGKSINTTNYVRWKDLIDTAKPSLTGWKQIF